MADAEVRRARPEDAETIEAFQVRLAHESEGLALDHDTVARGVAAVFADPAKGGYWVAEEDGAIVGVLLAIPEWSDWRNATVLWIHSLYVVPEARRRGVFKAMYHTLRERVARSPELAGLRLFVDKANELGMKVYEALGMTREHYHLYEWLK